MRVISGTARGRKLKEPDGRRVRPTTDKVKESMFNIVQFQIQDAAVLDLFAGSGQLGIEALSRGAESVPFVDSARDSVKLVLIFLDPPYDTDLIDRALEKIIEFDILKNDGIILCETKDDRVLGEPAAPYCAGRTYHYGKIRLTVIHRPGDE